MNDVQSLLSSIPKEKKKNILSASLSPSAIGVRLMDGGLASVPALIFATLVAKLLCNRKFSYTDKFCYKLE
jgi:hypothetical protein